MEMMRRLSDKLVLAHAQACAQGKREIAELLIKAIELEVTQYGGGRTDRRADSGLFDRVLENHHQMLIKQ